LLANKEQNYVCPFPFCFGFGSTLEAHRNISPSIGTPLITCSQTQIVKKEKKKGGKPSLPLKFLHIWQARNISLQQDKKKTTCGFFSFFIYYYLSLFCVLRQQPNASRIFEPAKHSNYPKQQISITKEISFVLLI